MLTTSLPPVVSEGARILILGTMPGRESLKRQQYYSHPGNAFWFIMGHVCGAHVDLPYEERVLKLHQAGIALWDVFRHCEREGSLDSKIGKGTEELNDFEMFFTTHTKITRVFFNGKKSAKAFQRQVLPNLSDSIRKRISLTTMPSTSPTNTHLTRNEKLDGWQKTLIRG